VPEAISGCKRSSTLISASSPRKEGKRAQLDSRPGNDLTGCFPLIVEALNGLSSFDRIRYRHHDEPYSCTPST
jgi:hypothetical protein